MGEEKHGGRKAARKMRLKEMCIDRRRKEHGKKDTSLKTDWKKCALAGEKSMERENPL